MVGPLSRAGQANLDGFIKRAPWETFSVLSVLQGEDSATPVLENLLLLLLALEDPTPRFRRLFFFKLVSIY